MEKTTEDTGISRRTAIKRGALVAGGAWAVPTVISLRTPAFAAGSPPRGCEEGCVFAVRLTRNQDNSYSCGPVPQGQGLCGTGDSQCNTSGCDQIVSAVGDPATGFVRVCFSCTPQNVFACAECDECRCAATLPDEQNPNCGSFVNVCTSGELPDTLDVSFQCTCPADD
jgi:hypothetical protein